MSVPLRILSSLLLVMAAVGGGLHANAEETRIISNTARITAYWEKMFPDTSMPSAILNLLTPTNGDDHVHASLKNAKKDDTKFAFSYKKLENNNDDVTKSIVEGDDHVHASIKNTKKDDTKFAFSYKSEHKSDNNVAKSNVQRNDHVHGSIKNAKKDDTNFAFSYKKPEKNDSELEKSNVEADNDDISDNIQNTKKDDTKFAFSYKKPENSDGVIVQSNVEGDDHVHRSIKYLKKEDMKFAFSYKNADNSMEGNDHVHGIIKNVKKDDTRFAFSYKKAENSDGDVFKSNVEGDDHVHHSIKNAKKDNTKFAFSYKPIETREGDVAKSNVEGNDHVHGSIKNAKKDDTNFAFSYKKLENTSDDVEKYNVEAGDNHVHGSIKNSTKDDTKFAFSYKKPENSDRVVAKSNVEGDEHVHGSLQNAEKEDTKFAFSYKRAEKSDDDVAKLNMEGHDDGAEGGHIHGGIFFMEDILIPGSIITPYIQPSFTLGADLLPTRVAESIPVSTRNFTEIMTMFAPTSYSMEDDIWSTLSLCDHPPRVKDEIDACVVSLESMVDFVSSVLGTTRHLRAFSSPNVPADGFTSGKRYKVIEVRRVTEAGDTVTCHGLRFPVALFFCHAVNPTRLYSVTLLRERHNGGPEWMKVLAVCHLDTSDFDPVKMPEHVKPGDAPLCHFIAKDNAVWARSVGAVAA